MDRVGLILFFNNLANLNMCRNDASWIQGVGEVKYYLYPVHSSRSFVTLPTLAASLYLLVLRFMSRNYHEVFQMADSVVSDTDLSKEEAQARTGLNRGCVTPQGMCGS